MIRLKDKKLVYISYIVILIICSIGTFVFIEHKDGYFWSAYIIVIILSGFIVRRVSSNDKKEMSLSEKSEINVCTIKILLENIDVIKGAANKLPESMNLEIVKLISELYDKVRFSDPMTNEKLKNIDNEIALNIEKLKSEVEWCIELQYDKSDNIKNIISEIESLIVERNKKLLRLK